MAEVKVVEADWVSAMDDEAILAEDTMDAGVVCVNKPTNKETHSQSILY